MEEVAIRDGQREGDGSSVEGEAGGKAVAEAAAGAREAGEGREGEAGEGEVGEIGK